jgi:hypothetical protein
MPNLKYCPEIRQDGLTKMKENMSSEKQFSRCDGKSSLNTFSKKS